MCIYISLSRLFNLIDCSTIVHFPQSRSALPPSFVKYNTKKTYPCLTPGECFRERVDILRGSGTDNYELNKQTLRLRQKFHSSSVRRGVWLKGESCIYIYNTFQGEILKRKLWEHPFLHGYNLHAYDVTWWYGNFSLYVLNRNYSNQTISN